MLTLVPPGSISFLPFCNLSLNHLVTLPLPSINDVVVSFPASHSQPQEQPRFRVGRVCHSGSVLFSTQEPCCERLYEKCPHLPEMFNEAWFDICSEIFQKK